jgi:transcriptional regulator with GAF, ATPase, and Fis domain
VGGNRAIPTDVRIIAATTRDLATATASGTFRADLFYWLNVFPIEVPPLRQRKEDIPMIIEKALAESNRKVAGPDGPQRVTGRCSAEPTGSAEGDSRWSARSVLL